MSRPRSMIFKVRDSKFRHVYGKPLRRDQCYDDIRITRTTWDSTFCSINPQFLAIITDSGGGGSFLVLPLSKVGRVDRDVPLVCGHKAAVLDIQWCLHNDHVIASASEDCTVKVWEIPEDGLTKNLEEPLVNLQGHQRRVGLVAWHPTANSILLSAGSDNQIIIWNVGTCEALTKIRSPDQVFSAAWSYNGSKVAFTCKKKLLVVNPRNGEILQEGQSHQGNKPAHTVYLKNDQILTTGFSRMSERQYGLWNDKDLSSPITMEEIDNNNAVLFPFYDPDTNVVYFCGKGDSLIRYYEVTNEDPYVHYLTTFQSNTPQRGIGFMPKRGLDVMHCEIARMYKLHNQGLCEVIPFTVPRKSELFQDDLYPDTASDIPALSADEWFGGKDATPILVPVREAGNPTKKEQLIPVRKSNVLDKMPTRVSTIQENSNDSSQDGATSGATLSPASAENFMPHQVLAQIQSLQEMVLKMGGRIKELEEERVEKPTPPQSHTDEEASVRIMKPTPQSHTDEEGAVHIMKPTPQSHTDEEGAVRIRKPTPQSHTDEEEVVGIEYDDV